jgi:vanillate O-demethylase monooxygenase subunit
VLNTITPSTATTCMYFWSLVRNHHLRDQTLTAQLRLANARIFEEDRAVLEAQQQAIDARPAQSLNNLNIDAGSLWARRLIDGMVQREEAR